MEQINNSVNLTESEASINYSSELINRLAVIMGSFSFLFGLPSNSYILWLIITGTGSGVASEIFNRSLSVCEICVCLNSLIIILSVWFSSLNIIRLCQLELASIGQSLFQCLICVERYLAVVHPVTFLKYKPLRYRVICCTVVWIITIGSCLFFMFIIVLHHDKTQTAILLYGAVCTLPLHLVVPMCGCSQSSDAVRTRREFEREREREEENHMKRRVFQVILITTVNTVIINIPNAVLGFITILTQQYSNAILLTGLAYLVLAGFVHPVFLSTPDWKSILHLFLIRHSN